MNKICSKCKIEKEFKAFPKRGIQCKSCMNAYTHLWRKTNCVCGAIKGKYVDYCRKCCLKNKKEAIHSCNICKIILDEINLTASSKAKFRYICNICQNNAARVKASTYEAREKAALARQRLRLETMNAYGGKCNCCGLSQLEFLTIDHIFENGATHRKETNLKGSDFYRWLRKNNYPQDEYQCLCMNCNFAKSLNFWGCPHKQDNFPIKLHLDFKPNINKGGSTNTSIACK